MKFGIVGGGYVGLHTAIKVAKSYPNSQVRILEVDENKINKFNTGESPIDDLFMENFIKDGHSSLANIKYVKSSDEVMKDCNIIFISLSTNPAKDEEFKLNTDLIFEISEKIKKMNNEISVIVRSTINISDSEKIMDLELNYWPEFLSQGVETSKNIDQKTNIMHINDNDQIAKDFFYEILKGKESIRTEAKETIFIKLMHNSLDAHLINLTNMFANISQENGMDFSRVGMAVEKLLEKRPKVKRPGIGYGGSCYPKDSYSLKQMTNDDINIELIEALNNFNNKQSLIFKKFGSLIKESKNVVVLGSSFKGGTNDMTKTPTIPLRNWLKDNDIKYIIWEPLIKDKNLLEWESTTDSIEENIKNADLVIVASDWSEFNSLIENFSGNVIDLKSIVVPNGKMNILNVGGN